MRLDRSCVLNLTLSLSLALALSACGEKDEKPSNNSGTTGGGTSTTKEASGVDLGLGEGLSGAVIVDGLRNPSGIAFDKEGRLTICDSGHGQVLLFEGGKTRPYITGFDTEFWKVDPDSGTKRFELGPLSAVWLPDGRLVVSDGGKGDGQESLLFFEKAGTADEGAPTNVVPPTSEDEADKGEGNLTGLRLSPDAKTIYVAGQGSDAKTWILACDVATRSLKPWGSADDHGVQTNSPMDTLVWDDKHLLALYSGAGGKSDGLIIKWNIETREMAQTWSLPGLVDPMGFDRIPGTDKLAVVDNNWALTQVNRGSLSIVDLPEGDGKARVQIVGTRFMGPVTCRFDNAGRLYIAQLGEAFDTDKGQVIAIRGLLEAARK